MKKSVKIMVPILTAAIAISTVSLSVHLGYAKTTQDLKQYTVDTNGEPLKIAIISDLQLPDTTDKSTHQYESFEKTLTMLKNKGMDALVIAGDFTDLSTKNAWSSFKEIYDKVMADGEKPISLYIMGNHDYWIDYFVKSKEIGTPAKLQKRFTKYTGSYPYSHTVINGYHFICWSSSDGTYDNSYSNKQWIRGELDKAVKDNPSKPVFVITHINPSDTAYGSDEWGNSDITDVLKDYSQVISISGHSHYSLIDERSVWQDEFTAFTTQSLDYIELESGKFNGSIPKDAYGNSIADDVPGCLYMEIEDEKITINRLEANTGKALKEPWILEAPFDKPNKFTQSRKENNKAPVLDREINASISQITDINGQTRKMLSFKSGSDDDFVHSYKIQFLDENKNPLEFEKTYYNGGVILYDENSKEIKSGSENISEGKSKMINELLYFSDFVLGLENMSNITELRLPENVPEDTVYISVSAIDSWGAESQAVLYKIK